MLFRSSPHPRGLPHGTAPGAEPLTAADEGGRTGGAAAVAGGVRADIGELLNISKELSFPWRAESSDLPLNVESVSMLLW